MTKRARKTWHSEEQRPRPSRKLPDHRDHPTISVERAAAILGVSRGVAYDAVRNGTIPSLRVGRRLLVPTARLTSLLAADTVAFGEGTGQE